MRSKYEVEGMHCASCASIIKRKLEKVTGVSKCEVNYGTGKAEVTFDEQKTTLTKMNGEINKLGYSLLALEKPMTQMIDHSGHDMSHGGHDMMTPISSDAQIKAHKLAELAKLKGATQIILPMVAISILVMTWEIGSISFGLWPEMPKFLMTFFHHLLPIFATYSLFVIGLPYLQGVVRFVKYRVANMDTLVGIGTSAAFFYSFIVTAFEDILGPYLNTEQNYYDVTIVVIGFITLGKFLEARSKLKTGEAIEKLLGLQVKNALVLRAGVEIQLPIDEVQVGEIVIVKPGSKFPLDGEIVEGESSVDEAMITGESILIDKKVGDMVIGATMNKQGSLRVRVTKIGEETMLAQIIKMVESAQGSKAPIERLADQISAIFVPMVLVFALVVFGLWLGAGSLFMPFSQALTLGLLSLVGVLVIACPCAMGLATPTAIIVGVGRAASQGILIKNAESLEKFAKINFVVMDKTGTLTKGSPAVTDVLPLGILTKESVLQILASLESHSEHPLAVAVVEAARQAGLKLSRVTSFKAIEGKGLEGKIEGVGYVVGNLKLVADLGLKADLPIIETLADAGKTPVVLMSGKKIIAYVGIADTIRDNAKEAVAALHAQGLKVAMLTGDNQRTASYIAGGIGIDQVIAEVLPGDKAKEVQKLQSQGYKVAMVGDGINDAPALATADVGIAMGTGTDVAIEVAGITLLGGNIIKLPQAVTLARSTMAIIKQNLFWAFFYNVVGIPVAAGILYPSFGILLSPALAGAAMGLSSVSVVLNSLRLKTIKT